MAPPGWGGRWGMTCEESREWSETAIAGLHVRAGVSGMRLLGWEGVLPLSVVRTVVDEPLSAPVPVLTAVGSDECDGGQPEESRR